MHALHRYRCRWAWVSSKPSRTTVPLPQAGQSTPFGQRCWRTRAKHLASSISAERLTRSGTVILEGPHATWPARAVLADYHRGPAGTLPRPPPTTPEPNKTHHFLVVNANIASQAPGGGRLAPMAGGGELSAIRSRRKALFRKPPRMLPA